MSRHAELREQRDQAVRDLAELDDQVADGEIDAATAADLRRRYEADAAAALRALERAGPSPTPGTEGDGRTGRGLLVAASVLAVAVVGGAVLALPSFVLDRPEGGYVTGNEVTAGAPEGRNLAEVTTEEMEAVVAQNPDIVPMRLALAHRYFDAGEFRAAFDHYMAVLGRGPDSEALSRLGWIVASDGETALGIQLLERSLRLAPGDPEATWFLANIRLYGQGEVAEATALLEALLEREDLGPYREPIEQSLADARAATEARP
ncbi:MAG: tetratricopeptide repeat protein [Actinobacteria bacterium]|nr:tetratricopeptide repeat protein [Actinomycetota bacterium]